MRAHWAANHPVSPKQQPQNPVEGRTFESCRTALICTRHHASIRHFHAPEPRTSAHRSCRFVKKSDSRHVRSPAPRCRTTHKGKPRRSEHFHTSITPDSRRSCPAFASAPGGLHPRRIAAPRRRANLCWNLCWNLYWPESLLAGVSTGRSLYWSDITTPDCVCAPPTVAASVTSPVPSPGGTVKLIWKRPALVIPA